MEIKSAFIELKKIRKVIICEKETRQPNPKVRDKIPSLSNSLV